MKSIFSLLLLIIASGATAAETAYVTDRLEVSLRKGESVRHKTVKMLTSGTELTVLGKNPASGYSHVRTADGTEGFILTRLLQKEPGTPKLVEQSGQKITQLENENAQLKTELQTLQSDNALQALTTERDKLRHELNDIRQTASNAIQLKQQRDKLQERVVIAERERQQLKRENQALSDNSKQNWFLYGGILAFTGIFLGMILPKLSRPRRSSSWDNF
ncbi:MAG: TIGR04211 family SH3 domain-containing protein [Gammaproteobacteria bacterium]